MKPPARFFGPAVASLFLLALAAGQATAAVSVQIAMCAERLSNGNTLITDGGKFNLPTARVIEVDSVGRLVWAYLHNDIFWAHSARRLDGGNTLISASNGNRVLEVTAEGNVAWEMSSGLAYPNEAWRLANGHTLITDRDHNRVIEVDAGRSVVWSCTTLLRPHGGNRLANGNTLACDSDRDQVVEVNSQGTLVWRCSTDFLWPRSAERLENGNTLIADTRNLRVIEVDSGGTVRWQYPDTVFLPFETIRLANGNTLIAASSAVREVTPSGQITWQYPPPTSAVLVESLRVLNPASGCSLYVHLHRPVTAGPSNRVPGVILVPDSSEPGSVYDDGRADNMATDGFAVLHFDADGRGRSGGGEDHGGFVQQDGLHACAALLAGQQYVDTERLGVYARGYGITMASGTLARHMLPRVKFLLDFEGPADRYQTCRDSGGWVPVSPDSEVFWVEREAARFMPGVSAAYLRLQTATDHNPRIGDNRHCIALIDSATSVSHGGSGMSPWTRVNDSFMNPANQTYTLSNPPAWVDEQEEVHVPCRELLYLHELAGLNLPPGTEEPSTSNRTCSVLGISPSPVSAGYAVLRWHCQTGIPATDPLLHVFDAMGRVVRQSTVGDSRSEVVLDLHGLSAGVYLVRLTAGTLTASAALVVSRP